MSQYMYGRFPGKLIDHMVMNTGTALCGVEGVFIKYKETPTKDICERCKNVIRRMENKVKDNLEKGRTY